MSLVSEEEVKERVGWERKKITATRIVFFIYFFSHYIFPLFFLYFRAKHVWKSFIVMKTKENVYSMRKRSYKIQWFDFILKRSLYKTNFNVVAQKFLSN